jgi:hypothetical protein
MVESSIINLPLKNDRPYARFLAIIRSRGIWKWIPCHNHSNKTYTRDLERSQSLNLCSYFRLRVFYYSKFIVMEIQFRCIHGRSHLDDWPYRTSQLALKK